MTEPTQR